MIIQLDPPIELVTPKGKGLCHFLIDYGMESDLHWVVFIHKTGECWTYGNPEIRACQNITLGRDLSGHNIKKKLRHAMIDGIGEHCKKLDEINEMMEGKGE